MDEKISITQEYSYYSKEDNIIAITWIVENNSDNVITNVKAISQMENNDFGDIEPNSSKSFNFNFKIPSLEDVKRDFGEDATVPNPYIIGPVTLTYKTENNSYSVKSNSLEI